MNTNDLNKTLAPLNELLAPLIKAGFAAPLNLTPGFVVLEVPGRKSGKLYTVPLMAYLAYPYVVVGTVRGESQWIKNLAAAEEPHVWVWAQRFVYEKTVVTDHVIAGKIKSIHRPKQ